MTILTSALAASVVATTSSAKPTTTSGLSFFLPLVIFALLAYLLFLRPRSQQARRQRQDMMTMDVGDEVLTQAGIFGTIVAMEGERVVLETAPNSQVTVLRSTLARRVSEPAAVDDDHDDWDDDHEDTHDERAAGALGTDTSAESPADTSDGDDGRGDGGARWGEGA